MTIAVIAKLNVAAGKEAEFEAIFSELVAQVNANEPGCKLYTLTKDADGKYTVMELYDDEAAVAAHGASEHFKAMGAKLGAAKVMGGRPEVTQLTVVA